MLIIEKQTKNIITRQWIQKELLFFNTASLRSFFLLGAVMLLLFAPIVIAITCGLIARSESLVLKIVLITVLDGIFLAPNLIFAYYIVQRIFERQKIKKGEFDILIHRLEDKREQLAGTARHHRIEYMFCFEGFLPYLPDYTIYQLASREDKFYLVRFRGQRTIQLLYPMKMYEYK